MDYYLTYFISIIPILVDDFNNMADRFVPQACVVLLIGWVLRYMLQRIRKEGFNRGLYLGVLAGVEAFILVRIVGYGPQFISSRIQKYLHFNVDIVVARWLVLYGLVFLYAFLAIPKHSRWRGVTSLLILLTTFVLGWLYARWVGMIFVSVPILLIFVHVIDKVAQAILPASNPEDKKERWQRTRAFLWYMLGKQYPFWVADKKASRKPDERIPGDPKKDSGKPGIMWTWPHQVVGLSNEINFKKVDGPGTIYTDKFEKPIALIDLRTHLHRDTVDAITSDGMQIRAVVSMAFAIDKERWPKDSWPKAVYARIKYRIGDNPELDHPQGSYPYSSRRVWAAVNNVGINTNPRDRERPEIYWDEWVIKQVQQAAREVLAQRTLDELWRPRNDGIGVSALDEIAEALEGRVAPRLAEIGVQLLGARVATYDLSEECSIAQQNIDTWSTYWDQQIVRAKADAEATYREEIEKAYAYSKSVLLDVIAESINAARTINQNLPRHVIAQYYVHALEEYIKLQPGIDISESKKRVEYVKDFLFYNRTEAEE